ncbi:hypothetical protein PGTDC60_0455 [Porphyromonas gingivalis TDC60]|nr:hypothetical protein PGTDC60_0455 [Porphyromonas gingivalis TDC60]
MQNFLHLWFLKTWCVNFFILAREVKKSRAKTKKILRHFIP